MFDGFSWHGANIVVHVAAAGVALGLGVLQLARAKGTARHRRWGRVALLAAGVSVGAALVGALVFQGKLDLLGVSLLVVYQMYSGLRALHLPANGRGWPDLAPALAMALGGLALFGAFGRLGSFDGLGGFVWDAPKVYATAGGMVFYGTWDCLRTALPPHWRTGLNPAEHAFKLTSLVGALASAGTGTLWPQGGSYAPLAASGVFAVLGLAGAVAAFFKARRNSLGVQPSASLKARLNTDSEL